MKIRLEFIWRFVPVPVIGLKRLPGRLVGVCLGPGVVVRLDYLDDWPTIVHELTHCQQFWRGLALIHLIRYYGSQRYRLAVELEAFREEINACPAAERESRLLESARALASGYGLQMDVNHCQALLAARAHWPDRVLSAL